jgi:starvation-inducible DNA-binding protein
VPPEDDSLLAIVPALQSSVDALLALYAAAKLAHWNVRGPQRVPLHDLFGRVADAASEHADVLAERIFQLGDLVLPSPVEVAPTAEADGLAVATALFDRIISAAETLIAAQEVTAEDLASLDALTDAARALDKLGADVAQYAA